jgi:hypothetical protein
MIAAQAVQVMPCHIYHNPYLFYHNSPQKQLCISAGMGNQLVTLLFSQAYVIILPTAFSSPPGVNVPKVPLRSGFVPRVKYSTNDLLTDVL